MESVIRRFVRRAGRRSWLAPTERRHAEAELASHLHEAALAQGGDGRAARKAIQAMGGMPVVQATFFKADAATEDAGFWRRAIAFAIDYTIAMQVVGFAMVIFVFVPFFLALQDGDSGSASGGLPWAMRPLNGWDVRADCSPTSVDLLIVYKGCWSGPDALPWYGHVVLGPILPLQLFAPALLLTYFLLCDRFGGVTLGRIIMGIRLEPALRPGGRPSWGQAFARNLPKVFLLLYVLDVLGALATSRPGERNTDRLLGLRAVRKRPAAVPVPSPVSS